MINRNFPTTTHYFPDVVADNGIYVDKTQFILPLLKHPNRKAFFLSRPRRFGKSMFVSTLEHVFLGRKDLFTRLYIYDKIEWNTYPVIRLSMDKIGFMDIGLEKALLEVVEGIAKGENIELFKSSYATRFEELIQKLSKKHQKGVVVLIDEYDKPIIQYLEKEIGRASCRERV